MEKIENEATEELEVNAETHDDSEAESPALEESSETKELTKQEYEEYRKLKRLSEKDSQKDGQETDQKEISNSADVEELIFANAGITSDEAKEAAKKLVKLGEAKNLMEAAKDEFVTAKEERAAADTTRQTATPTSSRRVPTQRKDTVEHWVDREGLPEDRELAHKVVQERRKKRAGSSMFGSPRNLTIK